MIIQLPVEYDVFKTLIDNKMNFLNITMLWCFFSPIMAYQKTKGTFDGLAISKIDNCF